MLLDWKGQSIQVRELGEGPAVVLVHGYPLDGAMWSGVARALSRSHRVFKPDLPGRGENPSAADGTIDGYADFIEAVMAQLPVPVGLAGFSMGGYVALALAMRDRPDSTEFLPRLKIPTIVLAGEHDIIAPPAEGRSMAEAIPGARFVPIAGAGHLSPMERPGAVAAALQDFFSSALGSPSG